MNRRPVAVTVVAWLFITTGALGLVKDWLPLLGSSAAQHGAGLRAEGAAMLALIWSVRALAVVGGVGLLKGQTWSRWLLVAWMVFHAALSAGHSFGALLMHCAIFTLIGYVLFRPESSRFFVPPGGNSSPEMEAGWVEVRSCAWLHEAQFLKSVLAGAGIEATIPNEHTLGVQPLYAVALGGVRVLVRPEDAERARDVLDSTATGTDASDDDSELS